MKCLVCGNNSWRYLFPARDRMFHIPGVFSLYRCRRCGLTRLDPVLPPGKLKTYYPPTTYYAYTKAGRQNIFGWVRTYLISHAYRPNLLSFILGVFMQVPAIPKKKPGKILDVGCGSGDTLSLLQSVGWDVYGLDVDKNAVVVARKRGIRNAALGSFRDMRKYPDNFFDAIRMYHVIEHLDDPMLALQLAQKKLKPGGELIVGTPNSDSLIARIAGRYWYNLDSPRHLVLFSPKTLTQIAGKNKFRDVQISFCSAGGWVGTIQYILEDILNRRIQLMKVLPVLLLYPVEWTLDKLRIGDVFVLEGTK